MDTSARHRFWEVEIKGHGRAILASDVLGIVGENIEAHCSPVLRARIAKSIQDNPNEPYLKCCECGNGLFYRNGGAYSTAHFYHSTNHVTNEDRLKNCQFYTGTSSTLLSEIYNGEGEWHFKTKHKLAKILEESFYVKRQSVKVERYIFDGSHEVNVRRKPDIQFEDVSGELWALELTRWWMNPLTIQKRQDFYRNLGINLLWLFSPDCKLRNRSTWDQIMFGSNIDNDNTEVSCDSQCNAFSISDSALIKSSETKLLSFDVEYPVYSFCENENVIQTDFKSEFTDLTKLSTAPKMRLPYAINTTESLLAAKHSAMKHNRMVFADCLCSLRRDYFEMLSYSNKMAWFKRYSVEDLRKFDSLISPGGKLNSRAIKMRAVLFNQYSDCTEKNKRLLILDQLKKVRKYYFFSKSLGAFSLVEIQGFLKDGISNLLLKPYRFAERVRFMYKEVELNIDKQLERNQTASRIRYLKSELRKYLELAKTRPEDLIQAIKYVRQLAFDIGSDSEQLTSLVNRELTNLLNQHRQYMDIEAARLAANNALQEKSRARLSSEIGGLEADLNANRISELPVPGSVIEIKFNRLLKECRRKGLEDEFNRLKIMREQYHHFVVQRELSIRFPKIMLAINDGVSLEVDYEDEVNRLILISKSHKKLTDTEMFILVPARSLIEQYEFAVACELHWVSTFKYERWPSNEVLIEIKKDGAIRARRILRALKPLIKNGYTECIDVELCQWLKDRYLFIQENPTAVRY